MTVRLLASEHGDNGGDDDFVDDNAGIGTQDDVGTDDADDQSQNDSADDQVTDDADADAQQTSSVNQRERNRRPIEDRAEQTRLENQRLANETAAATANSVAQATANAARQTAAEQRENEAVAAMTEEQRATYLLAKETQRLKQSESTTQALLRSTGDQNTFGRLITRKPQYEKYEQEVERRHQQALSQGNFVQREVLLAHLIGEKALKSETANTQRQSAQRRVDNQRSQSTGRSTRGDGGGSTTQQTQRTTTVSRAEKEDWAI